MNRKGFLKLLSTGGLGTFLANIGDYSHNKSLIKPKKLQQGDTIGLISPGFILPDSNKYDEIIDQIQQLGYKVKEGPNARNQYGYLAGTDEERAADLNAMFADNSVDAIMPFRGGWGCNRILPLIDFDTIRSNPKILVGYSDITTLLLSIFAKTGLITFHGPVGKSEWTDYTRQHFKDVLTGQQKLFNIPNNDLCKEGNELEVITPGKATGTLLGGNLSVLSAMMGSDYLPNWNNSILFLEDVGEDVYRLDRMLTQLKLNGVLEKISGFVFGQCVSCEMSSSQSLTLNQVFDDHIKPLGIPAFSGAMIGHIDNMITLPVGLSAEMNTKNGTIKLKESAVR
ncbi:S66 peptidase family protein [Fodinibius sp. AD559]|uniref:S66 peptidase family protein n=1 Tax=Fodinibius sp. AD559 TaxID=3424179 RepID=UPI00404701F9